jgi:HK97 family phage prohead protease
MKNNEKREIRSSATVERFDAETGIVEGYAIIFDSQSSRIGDFYEIIERSAVTAQTIEQSDIFALLDHNYDKGILARSRFGKGSLKLEIDDRGLKYQFTLPDTEVGRELRSHLEREEITASSFAFSVSGESWDFDETNRCIRTVKTIDRIYDVSPVFNAAYESTEVALRSLEQAKDKRNQDSMVKQNKERNKRNAKIMKMKLSIR